MIRVSHVVPALAVVAMLACVPPAFARGGGAVQRIRIYYQPASRTPCVDGAAMLPGASAPRRVPGIRCIGRAERAQDALTLLHI